jgi:hypothetical protein
MSSVDLNKMIDHIFSEPPQTAGYYYLDLELKDLEQNEETQKLQAANVAQVLMTIFSQGCNKLYGQGITPRNMTQDQFDNVNKYINSFGYEAKYEYIYKDEIAENGETIKTPINLNLWFEALN